MEWYWWVLVAISINWLGAWLVSWLYCGWLWLLSKDVKFEGWLFWKGWFPVARFRLISKKSWYAQLWQNWYGYAMFGVMIHRDNKGEQDDAFVEQTIIHELRHNTQMLVIGMYHWLAYAAENLRIRLFTDKDPYWDNWFEKDARAATQRWIAAGRPPRYRLGKRH